MYEYVVCILAVSVILSIVRLVRGPTGPDRVIALDAINMTVIALVVLSSLIFGIPMLVDIAIVYALLSFIGTLSISKYLLREKFWEE